MRRTAVFSAVLLLALALTLISREPQSDPRLRKATRAGERNGWFQVHLEGTPGEPGIADLVSRSRLNAQARSYASPRPRGGRE